MGVDQVTAKAIAVCENVTRDINRFIADFYASESDGRALVEEISGWQFTVEVSDEEYAPYEQKMLRSDLIGIIALLSTIFK